MHTGSKPAPFLTLLALWHLENNLIFAADVRYVSKERAQGQGRDALGTSRPPTEAELHVAFWV